MHAPEHCFTPFTSSIEHFELPERFTYPFYYEPHPLCLVAAEQLQQHLETQTDWQHNFGLDGNTESATGKMFGVLLVRNQQGQIGYLSAFSGKIADQNLLPHFVPPVFDMLAEGSFFLNGQDKLNELSQQIRSLEANPALEDAKTALKVAQSAASEALANHRSNMVEARKVRKAKRAASADLDPEVRNELKKQLSQESVIEKLQLRDLKLHWETEIAQKQQQLDHWQNEITPLIEQRRNFSSSLQQQLFEQYRFLIAKAKRNASESFLSIQHKAFHQQGLANVQRKTTTVCVQA